MDRRASGNYQPRSELKILGSSWIEVPVPVILFRARKRSCRGIVYQSMPDLRPFPSLADKPSDGPYILRVCPVVRSVHTYGQNKCHFDLAAIRCFIKRRTTRICRRWAEICREQLWSSHDVVVLVDGSKAVLTSRRWTPSNSGWKRRRPFPGWGAAHLLALE